MRRYLNMERVPVGPFGHRVCAVGRDEPARDCEVDPQHGTATHVTIYLTERGRRRSAIYTTEQFVCASCARAFARDHHLPVA